MNSNLSSRVYRRVQASEASAVAAFGGSLASHSPLLLQGGAGLLFLDLQESKGPYLAASTRVKNPAHASSKGFLLANSVTSGLRKQDFFFFFNVAVFFIFFSNPGLHL